MNSRKTGVGFNIPKSKIKPRTSVSRQDSDNFSEAVANSTFWNLKSSGSYIYGARGTAGVTIINASTPGALTETFSSLCHQTDETTTVSYRCMDIDVTGNTMVAVSRSGTWEGTGIGYIETWDITTPGSATVIDVYTKNATDAAEASPHLYSAVECNGNYAYVSGQKSGFYIFDVSGATITLTGSVTTGSWETQGLCYNPDDQHVYCANYTYGLTSIDVSTPAAPTVSDTLGTYTGGPDGDSLRPWDCVAHEGYLYCCCNVSNAFGDSTDRGLIVADISTPSNMSWVGYCQIPPADQDTWNSLGDRPYLGIERFENFIFISGGHKGVYCFDISEPTKPRYCGIVAVPDSGDNLYAVTVQGQGANAYLVYADGENGTSGSKKVYIDKIEIKKKRIINISDTTNPVAGTLTATQASSSQINISLSGQSDDVGIDHIILSWSPNGTDTWTQLDATWDGSTYNHTGLTASTQYFYRAVVYDAAGNNATATDNATTAAAASSYTHYVAPFASVAGATSDTDTVNGTAFSSATSISTPCTFGEAMANAVAGNTVGFLAGNYIIPCTSGDWTLPIMRPTNNGTALNPITFMAHEGATVRVLKSATNIVATEAELDRTAFGCTTGDEYIIWDGFQPELSVLQTAPAWQATTSYPLGSTVTGGSNGLQFESSGGTSGGTPPDFASMNRGDTVIDNDITWTAVGVYNTNQNFILYEATNCIARNFNGIGAAHGRPRSGGNTCIMSVEGCTTCEVSNNTLQNNTGFTLGAVDNNTCGIWVFRDQGTTFSNNEISGCAIAIGQKTGPNQGTIYEHNHFHDNYLYQFRIIEEAIGSTASYIRNNLLREAAEHIFIEGSNATFTANDWNIYNNTMVNATAGVVLADNAIDPIIRDNIFYGVTYDVRYNSGSEPATQNYNCFYPECQAGPAYAEYTPLSALQAATVYDDNSTEGNPNFVNAAGTTPASFVLDTGSSCIGTGTGGTNIGVLDLSQVGVQ